MTIIGVEPDQLPMWVIYDHPDDYPEVYVARLWISLPEAEPTGAVLACADLAPLREYFANMGAHRLDRSEGDDPKIVETWLL